MGSIVRFDVVDENVPIFEVLFRFLLLEGDDAVFDGGCAAFGDGDGVALGKLDVHDDCVVNLLCYFRSLVLFAAAVDVLHALRALYHLAKRKCISGLVLL